MWKHFNPNPIAARVGDCVVRAISKATGDSWEETYLDLCIYGLMSGDMPSSNAVWGTYLLDKGFKKHVIEPERGKRITVADFCKAHPTLTGILALSGHVVAVSNGDYFDTWDSGGETPVYYWEV